MAREIVPQDYLFKTEPYAHQKEAFELSKNKEGFALFMEMGTGKTKVIIDTAGYLYSRGYINFLLILAPNGVHVNWVENEIPIHLPEYIPRRTAVWRSDMRKAERVAYEKLWDVKYEGLRILAVNVEAIGVAQKWWRQKRKGPIKIGSELDKIFNAFRIMSVVDECTVIKTPSATTTRRAWAIGRKSLVRRILTGTPVTNTPLDLYGETRFLGTKYLGFDNFFTFKTHFAIWEKQGDLRPQVPGEPKRKTWETIVGYKNLDELTRKLARFSYRVLKKDCLDLPEQVFMRRYMAMTSEQRKMYNTLRDRFILEVGTAKKPVASALSRMMRLQQITGGWVPDLENHNNYEDRKFKPIFDNIENNPRIKTLLGVIEELGEGRKVVIWARFRVEIEAITDLLNKKFPGRAAKYYGGMDARQQSEVRARFQGFRIDEKGEKVPINENHQLWYFVGQQKSGGRGLTLTAASYTVYYSNDFSLEFRLQSQDRIHRIGQEDKCTYLDIECKNTIDGKILKALLAKKELADLITQDEPTAWLQDTAL